ncbi:MAG: xylulokinase [Chloroflexi bacterium]|nr:xylulokinase [Chloroflexota bacterium]
MTALLGIDLGTSSVKAVLATDGGQIEGLGSAEYAIDRPRPDWAEQQPEDWWRATISAVHQALNNAGVDGAAIAGIGLSGQMHGTVLLGRAGEVLAPAIIWPDRRSERQVAEITGLLGRERIVALSGSPVATGFQAATLRWVQQKQPGLWRCVHTILLPKDYLRWRLTGRLATDPSDGSGSLLLDVRRRDWSPDILEVLDIDRECLPPVRLSSEIAGALTREAAAATGLRAGTPVVIGAADTACSMLGAGVIAEGDLMLTISTGGQIVLPCCGVQVDPRGRIHTFCAALSPGDGYPGWYQMAAILSSGLALRWLRDQVLGLASADAFDQMSAWAEEAPAGGRGLLFLPYLTGERTPHMDPQARGVFLGLTADHGRAELVRAVMEGVALACYDAFSVLVELGAHPERIVIAGGGARSPLWRRIMCDVFGAPLQCLEAGGDQSAIGAALLAGGGCGILNPAEAARSWASLGPRLDPDPTRNALYQDMLNLFREAYVKHREDFRRLREFASRS